MRLSEEMPIDPDVLAELEAIDATLRGEAVDPAHADLAELALLLADQRAALPADAAQSLDAAVARRFEPARRRRESTRRRRLHFAAPTERAVGAASSVRGRPRRAGGGGDRRRGCAERKLQLSSGQQPEPREAFGAAGRRRPRSGRHRIRGQLQ